jgi:hypothetical protein
LAEHQSAAVGIVPCGASPTCLNRQSPGRDALPSGTCDEARETSVAPEDAIQPPSTENPVASELLSPATTAGAAPPEPPEAEAALEPLAAEAEPEPPAVEAEPEPPAVDAAPPPDAPPPPLVLTPAEYAERLSRLGQLLDGAEKVLAATDLPDARTRWNALRRDWTALTAGMTLDEPAALRVADLEHRIDVRDASLREARSRQQHDNLGRLQALCEAMEKVAQGEHLSLRDAEHALRETRTALDAPGPLPSRQDQQAIVARLKGIQSLIFPRVQDLREADGWERWANAGVQETLITRLEALREQPDAAVVARQLRLVQDEWHKVRAVPREKGRELWQRYKIIEGELRLRCESFFEQMASERVENLRQKEALCAQVEALADSTDWIRTAETIKSIQAQWKTLGPVTPGHEKAVWERFRAACDRFFTRRKTDLTERKTVWLANLKKKEAICAEVEALGDTTDWDHALAEVKRIQAEWRLVGPVKRSRSEALLARFHAAGEKFFDRYAHRNDLELAQQIAARELVCVELESLLTPPEGGQAAPDEGFGKKVLALKRQWDQAPVLAKAQGEPLAERFATALAATIGAHPDAFKGTELDPEAARKRMEQLCQIVEGFAGEEKAAEQLSPAAILATQLREALAANTIGGRADDEARWRNGAEEVRKAQAGWRRLGPVPDAVGREMEDRFQRACNRFFRQLEQRRRPSSAPSRH